MPLYEFHCSDCNHDVELLVRASEKPACPDCGSEKLEKLLSVPASPAIQGGLGGASLPMASEGGCGRPQCGSGRCMFGD